jgi:multidrug efflux pump subunit AcrB
VQQLQLVLPPTGAGASGAGAASLSGVGAGGGLPGGTRPRTLSISDVTTLKRAAGPTGIRRRDRQRTITVTANIDSDKTSQGVNQEAMRRLKPLIAANPDVRFEFGGEWEKTSESLESLLSAFLVALLVIYLILGAQFRSFVQPFVVLFAVPLSVIGVVTGFFVSGNPIDMMALIGLVGLTGIVVNDSLILVDFVNQRRRQGMPRREAIVEAGKLRLRPILLTTVTTVGGLMPLSMGWFGESGGLAPMATAIAWGLSFATILILYIVPSAYAIVDDVVGLIYRMVGKPRQWKRPDLEALDELDRLPQKEMEARADKLFLRPTDSDGAHQGLAKEPME